MKRPRLSKKTMAAFMACSFALSSCSDMDKYFETPSWIRGSIYEELASSGEYGIFLKGVDLAGYQPILNGKSILTVMAPNDEAMTTYISQNYGKSSIEELSTEEIKKLIGFHILYYSFDKNKLVNFRPQEGDGATEEEKLVNAGLYYKFRTKSQDPISVEHNVTDSSSYDVSVYHLERYLPVYSHLMFRTKGIDAKGNYEYFYPETGWKGDGGFNVSNASVLEYETIAKNGYIYKIDRVLRPLETIYKEMKNAGKYNKFLAFYDSFRTYTKDEDLTLNYGNGTDLYQVAFSDASTGVTLPPIASEWPVSNYRQVTQLAYNAYSIFAPTDNALQDFFEDYWKVGGYQVLDSVSPSLVSTLLHHCIYSQSIVFPEEIEKGVILDSEAQPIKFNTSEVPQEDRVICSNGVLYGCAVLTPPAMFNSVTGPAYQYKKYSTFQTMLSNSGMQSTLCQDAVNYIMLYPDNDQLMNNAGITVNESGRLISTAQPNGMSGANTQSYIYTHVVAPTDGNTVLPTSGKAVFRTLSPDMSMYWYVKNGKITNCIKHNELLKYAGNTTTEDDVFAPFTPLDYRGDVNGWANGHAYSYKNLLFEGNYNNINDNYLIRQMWGLRNDTSTDFYGWINLLNKAGMFVTSSQTINIMAESSLMFIPVTRAIEQGIIDGRIPGIVAEGATVGSENFFDYVTVTDEEKLQYYLSQYFVPLSTAVITNYPYVGWGEDTASQGGLLTYQQSQDASNNILQSRLNVYDDGARLSVATTDHKTGITSSRVYVTPDYDYFPFVYEDGAAHFIEDIF